MLFPQTAIETYLKHRFFLSVCETGNVIKYNRNPIKRLSIFGKFSFDINITVLKTFIGYFIFSFVGGLLILFSKEMYLLRQYPYAALALILAIIVIIVAIFFMNLGVNFQNGCKELEADLGWFFFVIYKNEYNDLFYSFIVCWSSYAIHRK